MNLQEYSISTQPLSSLSTAETTINRVCFSLVHPKIRLYAQTSEE